MKKSLIACLIVTCLSFAGAVSLAHAEPMVTPRVEFRASIEHLVRSLESGDTDAVQSAASTLLNQSWRTGWNGAAVAMGDETQRLCRDGHGPADADWQRLVALCRRLLIETETEPERGALREHDLAETRKVLTEILAAPEYHGTAAPGG